MLLIELLRKTTDISGVLCRSEAKTACNLRNGSHCSCHSHGLSEVLKTAVRMRASEPEGLDFATVRVANHLLICLASMMTMSQADAESVDYMHDYMCLDVLRALASNSCLTARRCPSLVHEVGYNTK